MDVIIPIYRINCNFNIIIIINFINIKIPNDTNVAEWINADAGIGASIESGNHMWKQICTDFIQIHIKTKNHIKFINIKFINIKFINIKNWFNINNKFNELKFKYNIEKNINIDISLNLLKQNVLNDDLKTFCLLDQKFIKKNDTNPIISQKKIIKIKLFDNNKNIIFIINRFINIYNLFSWYSYLK